LIKELKDFGQYKFHEEKKVHIIRISPSRHKYRTYSDENAQKFQFISTTLHELRHASQKEDLGAEFWSKSYSYSKQIDNPDFSEFYSKCEVDARIYENKHVLPAVEAYNLLLHNLS
jgi:hypothetical protein